MDETLYHWDCSTCRSILPPATPGHRPCCSRHGWGLQDPLSSVCRDWSPPDGKSSGPTDDLRSLLRTLSPDRLFAIHGAHEHFEEVTDLAPEGEWRTGSEDPETIPF